MLNKLPRDICPNTNWQFYMTIESTNGGKPSEVFLGEAYSRFIIDTLLNFIEKIHIPGIKSCKTIKIPSLQYLAQHTIFAHRDFYLAQYPHFTSNRQCDIERVLCLEEVKQLINNALGTNFVTRYASGWKFIIKAKSIKMQLDSFLITDKKHCRWFSKKLRTIEDIIVSYEKVTKNNESKYKLVIDITKLAQNLQEKQFATLGFVYK